MFSKMVDCFRNTVLEWFWVLERVQLIKDLGHNL